MRKRDRDTEAAMHSCEDALALLERLSDYELPALRRQLAEALSLVDASPLRARRILADALHKLDRGGAVGQAFLRAHAHLKGVWWIEFHQPYNEQKGGRG